MGYSKCFDVNLGGLIIGQGGEGVDLDPGFSGMFKMQIGLWH